MGLLLRRLACTALLLGALAAAGVRAREPGLPEQPYPVCTRFPTTNPAAVVVDVKEFGGAQIANNVGATQQTLDAVNTDIWCVDLNAITGFATDCSAKSYLVRFVPDAANCAAGSSPSDCPENFELAGGATCKEFGEEQTVVYPTVAIPSRGITSTVISKGAPSYIKHEVKVDTITVAFTWYSVFYYDPAGRVEKRLRSLTVPSP